ncbi:MAG: DAK2 domain-containing protein [Sphaerochaetaceae bacterium]|nr:DAK2 domain-containing protein [Sphaerochaetaceae bacterium]
MLNNRITGSLYAQMVRSGAYELSENKKTVNDLNVFPIPDGDTGDNMLMTIAGGVERISQSNSDIGRIASEVSNGMFASARGNSGVILSRIFAGISRGLEGKKDVSIEEFSKALLDGSLESYKAVANPVEGTVLTVYRDAVNFADSRVSDSSTFESYFTDLVDEMEKALERTPEQLDVLKEAGVVDSGGAGFVYITHGMQKALSGESHDDINLDLAHNDKKKVAPDYSAFNENSELVYGYCTEFVLQLLNSKVKDVNTFDEKEIYDYLNSVGESVVAFREKSIVRVHVHTKTPGDILNHCQKWGEFLMLKIENMTLQHNETIGKHREELNLRTGAKKSFATVAVASGDGIVQTFKDLGVDEVVSGGQSMNPSVNDFIKAFEKVNARTIFVFPDNGNIIMTAKQAAESFKDSDVRVIENHDVGSALAALSVLDLSSANADEIVSQIEDNCKSVLTLSVAKANRNTVSNGVEIKEGEYICFEGKKILSSNPSRLQSLVLGSRTVNQDDYGILMVFYGKDVSPAEAEETEKKMKGEFGDLDVILINGKQDVYDYIMVFE